MNSIKYPRTSHVPWSKGITNDDNVMSYEEVRSIFSNKNVVVTEKLDGECLTLLKNGLHARSIDGRNHISRNWIKRYHSEFCKDIPENWRICGEYLYAKHSIFYDNLPSYFMVFAIFNERNICLSFNDMVEYCKLLGLECVPVLYVGKYQEEYIRKNCFNGKSVFGEEQEGYVMRLSEEIEFINYPNSIAKFVRKNHVTTSNHWMYEKITKNRLRT